MNEKERDIPAVISSANVERGDDAKKAHTYLSDEKINSSQIQIREDVYVHLSPLTKKAADFFREEGMLKVIPENEEAAL